MNVHSHELEVRLSTSFLASSVSMASALLASPCIYAHDMQCYRIMHFVQFFVNKSTKLTLSHQLPLRLMAWHLLWPFPSSEVAETEGQPV
jgi:hypothetical protein